MAIARSKILGAAFIVAGLALLLVGASASVALLGETASTPDAARAAPASNAPTATRVEVELDAAGLHLGRAADVDTAAFDALPAKSVGVDKSVQTPDLPLPVGARLGLHRAPGDASAPASGGASALSATVQRVASPVAQAVALGAAACAGAGLLAYFRPNFGSASQKLLLLIWTSVKTWAFRLVALPIVGLYARVGRAEVFENAVRERIFLAIKERPGLSASDLAKLAGVSWGTTIYHLEVLEQNRMVTSLRKGRHRRYVENGAQLVASKEVVAILQNPVTANVAKLVQLAPGMTQKDLAGALHMSPQALHWHLRRLAGAGVVRKQREGRVVRHFASAN